MAAPRLPIQDGGPHGVRSKMAAPRSQIQDGLSLCRVRLHLGGRVNALDHEKVASRPRARCRSSSLYTRGIYGQGASHLSNLNVFGGVYIEDFWEGSV